MNCYMDRPINNNPLVSVVIPLYNREHLIKRTLDCVKAQSHRPIELIVIDDGSSDGGYHVVSDWKTKNEEEELTVNLVSQSNSGAPAARNHGVAISRGEYLQFLDSDDVLFKDKIFNQVQILRFSACDFAVCDYRYIEVNGGREEEIKVVENSGDLRKKTMKGHSVYTSSPLIRSSAIKGAARWDERLKRNQDIDFAFRLLFFSRSYCYTPGVWCDYHVHEGGRISDSYRKTHPQHAVRIVGIIGLLFSRGGGSFTRNIYMVLGGSWYLIRRSAVYWLSWAVRSIVGQKAVDRVKVMLRRY